jgi:PilZ domain-containing protein
LALLRSILYRQSDTEEEMNTDDRRAPGAARIPFDCLVEVGGALGPSFEAHAVNVSEEGMQLRTAYLPELGQQITCRFETTPRESVIGSGEVVWCRGAEKGGEFGIRFTDIDAESVDALKRVCGFSVGAPEPAQPGAKVRLYIDGLASPMRAKIRDAHSNAITVGSDLGFLQVGKQLELEDSQSGTKRPASIDRVDVAVDPSSHIPQLIVTLRYTDVTAKGTSGRDPNAGASPTHEDVSSDAGPPDDLAALDEASARMKGVLASQAARVGPAFQRFAERIKVTIALLAKRRRVEGEAMPRRTTAPPPGGGLRSSGRRVVRGEASAPDATHPPGASWRGQPLDDGAASPSKPTALKRRTAVAAVVMIAAIFGAVAIKRAHHEPAPGAAAATPEASATAVATANAPAPAAAQPPAAAPAAAFVAPASGSVAPNDKVAAATSMTPADEGNDASHKLGHNKNHPRPAPFGNGPVHHGDVLQLRMDGPVETIEGAQQPTGFTVRIPGRRSLEAAGPLAARDSRIGAIKVQNEPSGAELTVAFKDGVPNYRVSARGDVLFIALAPVGPLETTVAKRDTKGDRTPKHSTRGRDANPER